jgi:hypothetical protein
MRPPGIGRVVAGQAQQQVDEDRQQQQGCCLAQPALDQRCAGAVRTVGFCARSDAKSPQVVAPSA